MNEFVEWLKEYWMLMLALVLIFLMATMGWIASQ